MGEAKRMWIAKSLKCAQSADYLSFLGNDGLTNKSRSYSKSFDRAFDKRTAGIVRPMTGPPAFMPYEIKNGPASFGFDFDENAWSRSPLRPALEAHRIAIGNPDRVVFIPDRDDSHIIITLIFEGRSSNSTGGSQDTRNSQPLEVSKEIQGIEMVRFNNYVYKIYYISVWDGSNTWTTTTGTTMASYKFNKEVEWGAFPISILVVADLLMAVIHEGIRVLQ